MTTAPIDWYTARAAGIVAYLLLTGVVLVGLTLSGQVHLRRWPKFAVTDVHRFGGLLVGAFVSIHVATIAIDSYTPFSFTQLLVPLTSHYRPIWTSLGIVGAELLVALAITNTLRRRIPYRWWRRIHVLNFVVWGGATLHAIGAGTDTRSTWMVFLYIAAVSSVLAALAWRVARRRLTPVALRSLTGAAGLSGIAVVLGVAAMPHTSAAHRAVLTAPKAFSDRFTGSLAQQNGVGGSLLSVTGTGTGGRRVLLRIDLLSTDGQSISNTALQLEDVASRTVCQGTVSSVSSAGFRGSCAFTTGESRSIAADWRLTGRHLAGTISLRA
jgi:DMSO/TMAO reductase YedYZ heme-binding membrane subunit